MDYKLILNYLNPHVDNKIKEYNKKSFIGKTMIKYLERSRREYEFCLSKKNQKIYVDFLDALMYNIINMVDLENDSGIHNLLRRYKIS